MSGMLRKDRKVKGRCKMTKNWQVELTEKEYQVERILLTVTDLKQYTYCPRILYFTYVLPVPRIPTKKMDFGKNEHLELDRLERRRKLKRYGLEEGERIFHAHLSSERLGLEGKLDLHIKQERQCYPVEFKHSQALHFNHKIQLGGYALLLEDHLKTPVHTGFVCLIPVEEIVPVPITFELRDYVNSTMEAIRRLIVSEALPRPTAQRHRCQECEYRRYCGDVMK